MEYKIITVLLRKGLLGKVDKDIKQVEQQVGQHIKEGWTPLGGISYASGVFVQAMIKEKL